MAKIDYTFNQELGDNIYYLRDVESIGSERKAVFKCGYCFSEFITSIRSIKSKRTKSCGCKASDIYLERNRRKLNITVGDLVNNCLLKEDLGYKYNKSGNRSSMGKFICFCGKEFICKISRVKNKYCNSCGCLTKTNHPIKHGRSYIPEYRIWIGMKVRCYDNNCINYCNYGGRGITISDNWLTSFSNFYQDMGPRPTNNHSIDRIDVNGNYCKENCRWATREEQDRNKTTTIRVQYNNQEISLSELARIGKCHSYVMKYRIIHKGMSPEEAVLRSLEVFNNSK